MYNMFSLQLGLLVTLSTFLTSNSQTFEVCAIYNDFDGNSLDEQVVGLTRFAVENVNADFTFDFVLSEINFTDSDTAFEKIGKLGSCNLTAALALIGPRTSIEAAIVYPVANTFNVPAISYAASSAELSDDTFYPLFARVIHDDFLQAEAAIDFIEAFDWRNLALVYPEDVRYGALLSAEFTRLAGTRNVDIAFEESFDPEEAFPSASATALSNSGANIFVLLCSSSQAVSILEAIEPLGLLDGENVVILLEDTLSLPDVLAPGPSLVRSKLGAVIVVRTTEGSGSVFDDVDTNWPGFAGGPYPDIIDATSTGLSTIEGNLIGQLAYDAVLLLANAVNITLENGDDVTDGEVLVQNIRNTDSLLGASGNIEIDATGNRLSQLVIGYYEDDQVGGQPVVVGNWTSADGLSSLDTVIWGNGLNSTVFVPADQLLTEESSDCPCIDPFDGQVLNANCPLVPSSPDDISCVTASYGSAGCFPYDNSRLSECIGDDPPYYCQLEWCYVDPENCDRDPIPATSITFGAFPDLFRSYTTCGNVEGLEAEKRIERLNSLGSIRVSYPGSSGTWTMINNGDGDVEGSFPLFFDRIFEEHGIEKIFTPISQTSFDLFPLSSYSACVHEVALGNTDICVADHFSTSERRAMSTFVATIYDANLKVLSKINVQGDRSVKQLFENNPVEVFDSLVWFLILVSLMYGAGAVYYIDIYLNKHPDGDDLVTYFFMGFSTFTGQGAGSERFEAKRRVTMMVILLVSFFSLIFTALFTAQMTSNFVTSNSNVVTEFNSIRDVLSADAKICMLQSVRSTFESIYGTQANIVEVLDSYVGILERMDANDCDVGLISEDEFDLMNRGDASPSDPTRHCDKTHVGDTVLSISASVPISEELQGDFSWKIESIIGDYEDDTITAQRSFFSNQQICNIEDVAIVTSLTLYDIRFILICYFIGVTCTAGVVTIWKKRHDRKMEKVEVVLPLDNNMNDVDLAAEVKPTD